MAGCFGAERFNCVASGPKIGSGARVLVPGFALCIIYTSVILVPEVQN